MGIVWVFARTGSAFTALLAYQRCPVRPRLQTPDISGTYGQPKPCQILSLFLASFFEHTVGLRPYNSSRRRPAAYAQGKEAL